MMELYPIKTPLIRPGDPIAQILYKSLTNQGLKLKNGDILVIAETPVATAQGRLRRLDHVVPSTRARRLAERYELEPELAQLVLDEADEVLGGIPHVLLTIKYNTLMANAGIDHSNAPPGHVVLLPANPTKEAWRIKSQLEKLAGCQLAVIIADSRTQPLRLGTVGLALAVAGLEPVKDLRGRPDLYGRPLRITRSATADNLASAAQLLLGEAGERTPAVLIRGAPVTLTKNLITPQAMTIPPTQCLYLAIFREWAKKRGTSSETK